MMGVARRKKRAVLQNSLANGGDNDYVASPNFARACGRVSVGGHPDKRPDSRLRKQLLP
jgi:hypothetical protein